MNCLLPSLLKSWPSIKISHASCQNGFYTDYHRKPFYKHTMSTLIIKLTICRNHGPFVLRVDSLYMPRYDRVFQLLPSQVFHSHLKQCFCWRQYWKQIGHHHFFNKLHYHLRYMYNYHLRYMYNYNIIEKKVHWYLLVEKYERSLYVWKDSLVEYST